MIPPMSRIVLVTAQYLRSRHKAGFHWLAEAYWQGGWDVVFFTESLSWLSWLRGNDRFRYPVRREANRLQAERDRLSSFVWLTPFHPIRLRSAWLDRLSRPLFARYGRLPLHGFEAVVAAADLLIFDSSYGLLLFDRFREVNPRARLVYRVSDDLALAGNHPILLETETRILPHFHRVSVPCASIRRRLGAAPNVAVHAHGVAKELFDQPTANPYGRPGPHALFVGRYWFDHDFVRRAARLMPDWQFHIVGPIAPQDGAANVHFHGELPFAQTVPYLRHADIGLQPLAGLPSVEVFSDSLKVHQYTYCRLPIVAPEEMCGGRSHFFGYRPGDDGSIRAALLAARAFDRGRVPRDAVPGWDDLARELAAPVTFNARAPRRDGEPRAHPAAAGR